MKTTSAKEFLLYLCLNLNITRQCLSVCYIYFVVGNDPAPKDQGDTRREPADYAVPTREPKGQTAKTQPPRLPSAKEGSKGSVLSFDGVSRRPTTAWFFGA